MIPLLLLYLSNRANDLEYIMLISVQYIKEGMNNLLNSNFLYTLRYNIIIKENSRAKTNSFNCIESKYEKALV